MVSGVSRQRQPPPPHAEVRLLGLHRARALSALARGTGQFVGAVRATVERAQRRARERVVVGSLTNSGLCALHLTAVLKAPGMFSCLVAVSVRTASISRSLQYSVSSSVCAFPFAVSMFASWHMGLIG
jgi:hypothetical protein